MISDWPKSSAEVEGIQTRSHVNVTPIPNAEQRWLPAGQIWWLIRQKFHEMVEGADNVHTRLENSNYA